MPTMVVSGALANKPANGGEAWVRLSWIRGLEKLGYTVHFIEQIAPQSCVDERGHAAAFESSVNLAYFREVTRQFGLDDSSTLIYDGGREIHGATLEELQCVADDALMLINISGHLKLESLMTRFRHRAYVDIDPGFTQIWAKQGIAPIEPHDSYYTIAQNIGRPDCLIPSGGVRWRTVRQPVVLADWPVASEPVGPHRFTTIASWRGAFGPVEFQGKTFGVKVHEFRKLIDLPRQVQETQFEIALSIHSGDAKDLAALRDHGWQITDPAAVARTPVDFRDYVQRSSAEFSVAQGIYVDTNSGWFSDRTTRYLASGRPALVQETGFSRDLPVGEGIVGFRTIDEAVAGAQRITRDYSAHSQAARTIAEKYFDSDAVLSRLIDEVVRS